MPSAAPVCLGPSYVLHMSAHLCLFLLPQEVDLEEQWEDEEFGEMVEGINSHEHMKQVRALAGMLCCAVCCCIVLYSVGVSVWILAAVTAWQKHPFPNASSAAVAPPAERVLHPEHAAQARAQHPAHAVRPAAAV